MNGELTDSRDDPTNIILPNGQSIKLPTEFIDIYRLVQLSNLTREVSLCKDGG